MLDFKRFMNVPGTFEAEGFQSATPGVKAVFLSGPGYQEKETRIFAWHALPEGASKDAKVPGIVLVHGGGGTAYAPWVKKWTDRGFAAIAIDMFGGVPEKDGSYKNFSPESPRHEFSGPGHAGQFENVEEAPENQWPYHAVAAIMTANSFLGSLEEVDAGKIGLTGISWGGFAVSLAAGYDPRFKFVVPVYGCGGFETLALVPGDTSVKNLKKWVSLWDPNNTLAEARMPILWINGTSDAAFDVRNWNNSAKLAPDSYRALRVNMPHGQHDGEAPAEILPFAKAVLSGSEFPGFKKIKLNEETEQLGAKWSADGKIKDAFIVWTRASGCWNDCFFRTSSAKLNRENGTVIGDLPANWTAAYLSLEGEDGCVYTSEIFFNE
ncbi:MAG: Alpha/beta hydrolase family protein [Lentisphaerae bacterium ADurb.Bin242]|nr:MAG: Alpha/beta hydrolase family protein [Lentisphaerae bacterium ADurb.Bin242]